MGANARTKPPFDRYEHLCAHMNNLPVMTPAEIVEALDGRIRERRLVANLTQAHLADKASVSRRALVQLESGGGSSLHTLASILKALGLEHELAHLVPLAMVSPMTMLRLGERQRKRASSRRD
jgi:DNA-binding XRE family transcriptional regulator